MDKDGKKILLSHGSGGKLTHGLIKDIFLKAFSNPILDKLNDQAILVINNSTKTNTSASRGNPGKGGSGGNPDKGGGGTKLAFTTDSYVVNPIFFPGGDIGKLAVCGTVNDLAVGGARPMYLSASFIIEEGTDFSELTRVVESMARTAREAGVAIVTGDTKVVEKGSGDKIFINTSGIGELMVSTELGPWLIRPGDRIIVSGPIGDHGIAVLAKREGMEMDVPVLSDCAPLNDLVNDILEAAPDGVRAMRDPTRGGLATVLNEFAEAAGLELFIREADVPVREEVRGACEILGFDPWYLACEGRLVVVVKKDAAKVVLDRMRRNPLGEGAVEIGEARKTDRARVVMETVIGNTRLLDMLTGEQLPRIC